MFQRDVVIRVEGVSKLYRLGEVGTGSLAHDVNRWWHKVRGRIASLLEVGTGFHPELTEPSEVGFALHGPSREPEGWDACRKSNRRLARRGQHRKEGANQNIFLNGAILGMRKAEPSRWAAAR
jgi:hypothetical protein